MGDQPILDFNTNNEPVVEVLWRWSESGFLADCPLCERAAGIWSVDGPTITCKGCNAVFKKIPGADRETGKIAGTRLYPCTVAEPGDGPPDVQVKVRMDLVITSRGKLSGRKLTGAIEKGIGQLVAKLGNVPDDEVFVFHLCGPTEGPAEDEPVVQLRWEGGEP